MLKTDDDLWSYERTRKLMMLTAPPPKKKKKKWGEAPFGEKVGGWGRGIPDDDKTGTFRRKQTDENPRTEAEVSQLKCSIIAVDFLYSPSDLCDLFRCLTVKDRTTWWKPFYHDD